MMIERPGCPRRGVAVLFILVVLVVFGVALSLALRTNLAARAESRRAGARLQAEYLAVAGLRLAAVRLDNDPAYAGETWQVAATEFGGQHPGEVKITIAAADAGRMITVLAAFPADGETLQRNQYRASQAWSPRNLTDASTP